MVMVSSRGRLPGMARSNFLKLGAGPVAVIALFAAACGTEDSDTAVGTEIGDTVAIETNAATSEFSPSSGITQTGSVEVDGTEIEFVATVPEGFSIGDQAPVLLAFPPGGQSIELATSTVEQTYESEALRLGWVVVSPAAPNGQLFFNGSEALVPGFVDWVEGWVTPEGGAPHVAGISNGGLSSFRYATENPDRVRSVVAFPGFARNDQDRDALEALSSVPIQIYVGGNDTGWIDGANETVQAASAAGVDVSLEIFPDENHIIDSTSDGVVVFEQLERAR